MNVMRPHFLKKHHSHRHPWHHAWHRSIVRRFLFVLFFTGLVSLILWGMGHHVDLDEQAVYAYATSLPIWFLSDVVRQRLFPSPDGLAWSRGKKVKAFVFFSMVLGFIFGTLVGDWYSGFSTLNLLKFAPQKLAGLIILCAAISLAFTAFFYQQNRLQVAEQQATESKLQLLQSQLEPHMLFNTLANLRVLIDLDAARAQAMLDRLIDYLRATLGASRVTSHALGLEFARLDDYLALMHIRMGQRLRYTLDLPDALKSLACPALILQPLVENAVLHGLEPSALGGEVLVQARQEGRNLVLVVADTGLGFAANASHMDSADENKSYAQTHAAAAPLSVEANATSGSSHTPAGFGLMQLRERLSTLFAGRARVDMAANTPSGTRVTVSFPVLDNHETNHCAYC
jgi:sensor histidine kinase YesM